MEVIPSPTVVREQLERILSSEAFAGAGRHSRVLRYLVERTLAGEGDQLKEYVLGTEVFDRPDDYDPRIDSIVRVEVRRLRSRLEDYYRGLGATDPVRITIPRGAYVPVFEVPVFEVPELERRQEAAAGTAPAIVVRDRRSPWLAMIAAAVVVGIGLIVGTLALNSSRARSAQASTRPAIAVLPFEAYSTSSQDVILAARITDAVTSELARLGTVSVASRTSSSQYTPNNGNGRPVTAIAKALNVNFVIEASALVSANGIRVVVRLVDGVLDRKVWVGEYDLTHSEIPASARQIATEAAAAAQNHLSR